MLTDRKYRYMQSEQNLDYSKGYDSYIANDVVPSNVLVKATDTRISTLGRQTTRKGCDRYSAPAGQTLNTQQTSTTGAASQSIGLTSWLAAKFTTSAAGRLTRVDLNLKNIASATGPIIVEIRSDSSGPGEVLAQSSIPAASPTGSYGYLAARFIEAPLLANATAYWIVAYIQEDGSNTYAWSSTTNASTAKTSSNSGVSWSASAFDLNFKTYLSTDGGVLGWFRAIKSDGTRVTLMAYKEAAGTTAIATINDVTGALTNIKTGLSSSVTFVDFAQVQDVVYYVDGYDAPRKWDFTTEVVYPGSPPIAKRLKWHKNHMFFLRADDPGRVDFSDTAAPEVFTSTNFLYIPAPKSADPVIDWFERNDNLYFPTGKTKYALFGSDITNMVLREAPGIKGLVAAHSLASTGNHTYFASDDGVYRFNGSTDQLLSKSITSDYLAAANKDEMCGVIWNNRYYLFYTPSGEAKNSKCWVFNINFDSWESEDTGTHIGLAGVFSGQGDDGRMVQCSNLVGAIYYAELPSNSFNNLGKSLSWEIRTKYDHFGSPATNKHVKRWYPRFATEGDYSVSCQYDKDFGGNPTTLSVDLQGAGIVFGGGHTFGDGSLFGNSALVPPRLTVPGLARYIQRRYARSGVNLPVEFLGDTVYYFLKRPR